jgi:hypothetical protein
VNASYAEWNLFSETESTGFSNSTGEGTSQDGGYSPRVEDDVEPDPEETWEQFRGGANAENDGYAFVTQELANARRQKWEQAAQRGKLLTSLP